MNLFELSAVATPIAGALAGGASARAFGAIPTLGGVAIGLLVGGVLHFAAIGLFAVTLALDAGVTLKKLGRLRWLASFASVLVFAAGPVIAMVVTKFLVESWLVG